MQSKPLVVRYNIQGIPFALQFLRAGDFEVTSLRNICQELRINKVGAKNSIIGYIEGYLGSHDIVRGAEVILRSLISRPKTWFTFKEGRVRSFATLKSPIEIVYSEGTEEWYGPVISPESSEEYWYIRPSLIPHWELDGTPPVPTRRAIRWLFFARMTANGVSYHWQGFSYSSDESSTERESQFPYWSHVPRLITEFEKLIGAQLEAPNLHEFVLHQLWDNYRTRDGFTWTDLRIRAESGGVDLNARSAGADDGADIDVRGIQHLAQTLSKSVARELHLTLDITKARHLQETILQTIIRQFGAKSYEFSLQEGTRRLLKAHIYFGMKPNFPGPDAFPHIKCHTSWKEDQAQLAFIVDKISILPKNASSELIQPELI